MRRVATVGVFGRDQRAVGGRNAHTAADDPRPSPLATTYEYERHGAAVFMVTEPLCGWREAVGGDQRTAIDFAYLIKHLVDMHFADVEQIVLVMNQLNIYTPGSLDSPHSQPGHPCRRGQRLGTRPKRQPVRHRLAVHTRSSPHQTQAPVPGDTAMTN